MRLHHLTTIMLIIGALALAGCQPDSETSTAASPQPIAKGEECHLCGMTIVGFPGPKGQVFVRDRGRPLNFCSTTDMLAWLLQPEAGAIMEKAWVHDMGATDWNHPADDAWTDASTAWYVAGHPLPGAMGATLASFRARGQAEAFAAKYEGAEVMPYGEITVDLLNDIALGRPLGHHH